MPRTPRTGWTRPPGFIAVPWRPIRSASRPIFRWDCLLARQGNLPDARTELAAATSLDPGDAGPSAKARAWRALARIDRNQDPAAASDDLLEALKLSPETPEDTLLAAELAEKSGQNDAAEAAYRRLLVKDPKNSAANAGLAHLLIAGKQYPEAETLLRAALEKSPDDPALTAQLATVLAAENKAEALPLLQKLHADHPADLAITSMLAEVLSEAGDAAGSDQLYITLLAAHPDRPRSSHCARAEPDPPTQVPGRVCRVFKSHGLGRRQPGWLERTGVRRFQNGKT